MKAKITNISELRDDILELHNDLRNGKIGLREAKELNNTSGKIIASAKLELEYNSFTKTQKRIPFLETKTN